MAFGQTGSIHCESFVANADLRTKQGYCVKADTASPNVVLAGAAEVALGILTNKPNTGEAAAVACINGQIVRAVVNAGTDIAYGDPLEVGSGGKLVKCTTDKRFMVARAMEPATEDAHEIAVMIERSYFAV